VSRFTPKEEAPDPAPRKQGRFEGWLASLTGIVGSAMLATNTWVSGWGWPLYLVSSVTWCGIAMKTRNRPLLAMNAVFTLINVVAIWRWMPWR